jgi:hypothetical protein
MAANELPGRPNLEQLRRRAKELLSAVRNQDAAALGRAQPYLARPKPRVQLADTQRVIAGEYGFSSWPQLKAYVEAQATPNLSLPPARVATESEPRPGWRPRRRGPRRMPSVREIQDLRAGVVEAARQGAPFPFIFGPPLGPSGARSKSRCATR